MDCIYETKSKLNRLRVYRDSEGAYYLRIGPGDEIHSMYDSKKILFRDPEEHYWNFFNVFPLIEKRIKKVLILGLGCGTVAMQLKHFYPELEVEGVEIDKTIVEIGRRYFGLDILRVKTRIDDAIEFVKTTQEKYDLIILDAFSEGNIAKEFLNDEVFKTIKSRLSKIGIFAINYIEEEPFVKIIKRLMAVNYDRLCSFNINKSYNYIIYGSDELKEDISVFETEDRELRKIIRQFNATVRQLK